MEQCVFSLSRGVPILSSPPSSALKLIWRILGWGHSVLGGGDEQHRDLTEALLV